jgi:hypothetical protein
MVLCMLYVYCKCRCLCSGFVNYFSNSHAGTFFQLIISLMGVYGLCNPIVAWRYIEQIRLYLQISYHKNNKDSIQSRTGVTDIS